MIMDALLQDPALPGAPHILLVSIPPPGHLFPFTSFAYQLAAAGAQVTCFTTGYVFEHLQHRGDNKYRDESSSGSCSKSSRVRFEGLFDYEEIHEIGMDDVMGWLQAFSNEKMEAVLERRFLELQPRPVCIVADMFLGWVQDVANKMHVPRHTLFTMNAKELAFLIRIPQLFESGELPGLNADDVMKSDISMPGMAPLPVEGVWGVFKDETVGHHQQVKEAFRRLPESKSIILNTFEELEAETLEALRTDYVAANIKVPELLPILLSSIPRLQRPNATNGNDQVSEVEKWLDTQAPASVIYISFGSLATLTKQQTGALALALEATNYPFIWVYRPPGISQDIGLIFLLELQGFKTE
ncbi:hypothetical protein M758_8G187400 [Ceratodon purpureus]|nr:hypothetical protein M758_8G187400 [Ceratodon purpureus]